MSFNNTNEEQIEVSEFQQRVESVEVKKDNIITGIVGAFIGTAIGVALIVILGQLGYIASIAGVVMAVCALKGYELLGGTLSKRGIVCSSVLILVMTYVGCRLDWAYSLAQYHEVDIFSAFLAVNGEYIEMGAFYKDLFMVYLFSLLGAVPTIRSAFANK